MRCLLWALALLLFVCSEATRYHGSLTVGGKAVPTAASLGGSERTQYLVSVGGILPPRIILPANSRYIMFNATGAVHYSMEFNAVPPDGLTSGDNIQTSCRGGNAIAGIAAPGYAFLSGVFLNKTRSINEMSMPPSLNFIRSGTEFKSLSPQRNMQFFIGDGLTGNLEGDRQKFFVPHGATHLFLGVPECSSGGSPANYGNNHGHFVVNYVIET